MHHKRTSRNHRFKGKSPLKSRVARSLNIDWRRPRRSYRSARRDEYAARAEASAA